LHSSNSDKSNNVNRSFTAWSLVILSKLVKHKNKNCVFYSLSDWKLHDKPQIINKNTILTVWSKQNSKCSKVLTRRFSFLNKGFMYDTVCICVALANFPLMPRFWSAGRRFSSSPQLLSTSCIQRKEKQKLRIIKT
jgi:hypothetical protein